MKKLLYLILLLPLWATAQTNGTIQKTSSTGTIRGSFGSLGLDTLVNANAPTNGFVPVYNSTLKKSVWTNPTSFTPTLSFGTFGSTPNAQGGSYSAGTITLQPASASHPGGVSTGTQTFAGDKTMTGSLTAPVIINSTIASTATNAITGNFINNSTGFATIKATNSGSGNLAEFANSGGVVASISNSGVFTGIGTGLSGVVLTTTDQSIAGAKTFTGALTLFNGSIQANGLGITGSGSKAVVFESTDNGTSLSLRRFDNSFSAIQNFMTGSSGKWDVGLRPSSENFVIRNLTTLTNPLTINISSNDITAIGSISSTPQGTLYGTATGSITSAQLATSLTDETGTGSAVFSASPTFTGTIIGASSNFSGSMGIGISPTFPLHVSKSLSNNYVAQLANTNTTAGTSFGLFMNAGTNGSDRAIKVNNADNTLTLLASFGNGDFEIGGSNATKASGTAWINPSDLRLKMNVGEYSKGLAEVLKINPKTWYFNKASGFDQTKKHLSPIAQELQKVMPEMVSTYKGKLNGKAVELLQVDASDMTWLLVKAIQEQQSIIEKLNQRITVLENK